MSNVYYDEEKMRAAVRAGEYREIVGGLWDEVGQLQFDFMKRSGLTPTDRFLDIGCGCLRGGVHFIRYLEAGNYHGLDLSQSLLDAGYEHEVKKAGLAEKMPRENLVCDADFSFAKFSHPFQKAIAISVFTHLPLNGIRDCLGKLSRAMEVGGVFYATFFELPAGRERSEPYVHDPGGITTFAAQDPFHYTLEDLEFAAKDLPWSVRYVGGFDHPRSQRMMAFTRTEQRGARSN